MQDDKGDDQRFECLRQDTLERLRDTFYRARGEYFWAAIAGSPLKTRWARMADALEGAIRLIERIPAPR